jgi:hypothetical protein
MILTSINIAWIVLVAYPVAPEPFPLVDIAFVGVVVPLGAVKRGRNANHVNGDIVNNRNHWGVEEQEVASH